MSFKPGDKRPENSGRKKGVPNKNSLGAIEIFGEGMHPIEFLKHVMMNEWKALGYDQCYTIKQVGENSVMEDVLPSALRTKAATELLQYLCPKRKAIEHTGANGADLFIEKILSAKERVE